MLGHSRLQPLDTLSSPALLKNDVFNSEKRTMPLNIKYYIKNYIKFTIYTPVQRLAVCPFFYKFLFLAPLNCLDQFAFKILHANTSVSAVQFQRNSDTMEAW